VIDWLKAFFKTVNAPVFTGAALFAVSFVLYGVALPDHAGQTFEMKASRLFSARTAPQHAAWPCTGRGVCGVLRNPLPLRWPIPAAHPCAEARCRIGEQVHPASR